MTERYTVEFNAKVTPVKPLNEEFTLCKCYVMALNKNRNLSYISQETADKALPTLFNIPVIGHLYADDKGNYHMGGHDMTLVKNEAGELMFKSICVPYGVVPQQENYYYEDVKEPNGDTKTYLVCDVILWTGRFPELKEAIYSDETYFGQSMEINVDSYEPLEEDKNYTNILNYTYSALCLLGKSDNADEHVEPCFPMASVEPYEFSIDNDKFSEFMLELKGELTKCFNFTEKEGEGMDANDTPTATTTTSVVDEYAVFSATYREKFNAIRDALPRETETNSEGRVVRSVEFYVMDYDDNYAYVSRDEWDTQEGYSESHGRFAYEFDEDNKIATLTSEFEKMILKWITKEEEDALEELRNQYQVLVEYKANREQNDREAAYDAAIKEFDYMLENEEYKSVYENRYSYNSIEELKTACYAIKGKYSLFAPNNRGKQNEEPVIPVGVENHNDGSDLHDRLHQRFGKR